MAVLTYTKTNKKKISKNFSIAEFVCHGDQCCSSVTIDEALVNYLQRIRDHFGRPVTVNSGYRCSKHNKEVGGATSSMHTKGKAADIVVDGIDPAEVAKYAEIIGVKGIGLYESLSDGFFVHIDTRSKKSFWYGHKQVPKSTFGGADEKAAIKAFVKDVQRCIGAAVDGIAGPETLSKTITITSKTNRRHEVVDIIQKRLHALGYTEVGPADGIAGAKFTSAIAHFQQDNGCVVDGKITAKAKTWKKLLGMI